MEWFTRAIYKVNQSAYGGTSWVCPDCDYPHDSRLPRETCLNCSANLRAEKDGQGITKIKVRKTKLGYERIV